MFATRQRWVVYQEEGGKSALLTNAEMVRYVQSKCGRLRNARTAVSDSPKVVVR